MNTQQLNEAIGALISNNPWLILLVLWAIVWKLIAMWKAAKHNHLTIFIVLAILNTAGIAEIAYVVYIYFKEKKEKALEQTN